MSTNQTSWDDWIGADVVGDDGGKIGTLQNVYMDRETGQPEWLLVKTGLLGSKSSFVPLAGADAAGDDLRVPYGKDKVKDAPHVDDDDGYLPPEDEQTLYTYYGRSDYKAWSDTDRDITEGTDAEGTVGHDTSGPATDEAMTRSEEELAVGTRQKEAGRVRLRKYVVTENVTTTVPVRKEKVRLEREPITEANAGKAMAGPAISEEEHEVVLNEEEVVVSKEAVPKERVRLDKESVVENQAVSDEVRKERIEVECDGEVDR
ncbi:MAG TPA: PRC and DUF2382 domain-containing protein [Aquihabitans sp.]|nr:PRC and DUF2382 domain-containing protein [Aquihabitans sp.]